MDLCAQPVCKKGPPEVSLKQCATCKVTKYCSRDCQKFDWKAHKKTCAKQNTADHASEPESSESSRPSASTRWHPGFSGRPAIDIPALPPFHPTTLLPSPPRGTDKPVDKAYLRLCQNTWLHDRSEKDVYRLLIDAYRMRAHDLYKFQGDANEGSLYDGSDDVSEDFFRFLEKVERAGRGILPSWWNDEKRVECLKLGMSGNEWQDLRCAVNIKDIQEHYGDPRYPMQLRLFAEILYGSTPVAHDYVIVPMMARRGE